MSTDGNVVSDPPGASGEKRKLEPDVENEPKVKKMKLDWSLGELPEYITTGRGKKVERRFKSVLKWFNVLQNQQLALEEVQALRVHNPSSRAQFKRRLAGFALRTWSWCGPLWSEACSPLVCAQHGWRLKGHEKLACEHCAATRNPPTSFAEKDLEHWAVLLQTSHEDWCPYRTSRTPDHGFTRIDTHSISCGTLRQRYSALLDMCSTLGELVLDPAYEAHIAERLPKVAALYKQFDDSLFTLFSVSGISFALAISGWSVSTYKALSLLLFRNPPETVSAEPVLHCEMCMATLSTNILQKDSRGSERGLFHPLASHMLYCPFNRVQSYRFPLHSMFFTASDGAPRPLPVDAMSECTLFQKRTVDAPKPAVPSNPTPCQVKVEKVELQGWEWIVETLQHKELTSKQHTASLLAMSRFLTDMHRPIAERKRKKVVMCKLSSILAAIVVSVAATPPPKPKPKPKPVVQPAKLLPPSAKASWGGPTQVQAPKATPTKGRGRAQPVKAAQPKTAQQPKAAAQPKAVQPKAQQPKVVQPKTTQPKAVQPKLAQPKTVQPKTAQPKTAQQPKAAQPKAATPAAAQPKAVQPKATQPKTTGAKSVQPTASQPKTSQPKAVQPKAATQPTLPKAQPKTAAKAAEPKAATPAKSDVAKEPGAVQSKPTSAGSKGPIPAPPPRNSAADDEIAMLRAKLLSMQAAAAPKTTPKAAPKPATPKTATKAPVPTKAPVVLVSTPKVVTPKSIPKITPKASTEAKPPATPKVEAKATKVSTPQGAKVAKAATPQGAKAATPQAMTPAAKMATPQASATKTSVKQAAKGALVFTKKTQVPSGQTRPAGAGGNPFAAAQKPASQVFTPLARGRGRGRGRGR